MLVNRATKILVDGVQVGRIKKMSIVTSIEDAFFFCEFQTEINGISKDYKYVVRNLSKEDHVLTVDCISTGNL